MDNIIEEIAEARRHCLRKGKECNTVIIPERRRREIEKEMQVLNFTWVEYQQNRKISVFDCDVIFSYDVDNIKVGHIL